MGFLPERASVNFDIVFYAVFELVYVSFSLKCVIIRKTFLDLILAAYDLWFIASKTLNYLAF